MDYPPLSKIRDYYSVQWYRSPLDPKTFRELSRPTDRQGWFQAGGHFSLFLATGALIFVLWQNEQWIGFMLALFLHGTVASFFSGIAPHELGHGTVFKTKPLNKFFLYLFSLLSWWDPFDYASSHTYHHRYTLHPEGDRENLLPLHPSVGKTFLLQLFTVNLFTQPGRTFGKGGLLSTLYVTILGAFGKTGPITIPSHEWLSVLHEDQPEQHLKSIRWSRILLLFHGALLVVSLFTGYLVIPLIVTFSGFFANWLSYFVALPQHCGLQENTTDFRKSVRSMKLNPFVEFLYWHMNWHTEHHMYAGVPCYNLKKLHLEIQQDMPEPRTLVGAWKEMLAIWEKQKSDPNYQFDTVLPATAKISRRRESALDQENSIGDLAPKGLN